MENTHHDPDTQDNWQDQNQANAWPENPATGEDGTDRPEPITENTPQTQNYASASDAFEEEDDNDDDDESDDEEDDDEENDDNVEHPKSDWGSVDPLEHPGPPSGMDPSAPGSAV